MDAGEVAFELLSLTPTEAGRHGLDINQDGRRRSAFELLSLPDVDRAAHGDLAGDRRHRPAIGAQLDVDARYAAYIERQELDVAALQKDEALAIPDGFDFNSLPGLSTEVRQKLE